MKAEARRQQERIFKKPYLNRYFICASRTALVRLVQRAVKPPENAVLQRTLTGFLRRFASAECSLKPFPLFKGLTSKKVVGEILQKLNSGNHDSKRMKVCSFSPRHVH